MKKLILSLLFASCTLILLDSCQVQEPDLLNCEVSYKNDLLPIIKTSCAGDYCHPSTSPDFSNFFVEYENIKTTVDNGTLNEQIVELKNMPKNAGQEVSAGFLEEYRDLFACWIEAGGPDN